MKYFLFLFLFLALSTVAQDKPNVIIFYCDDLGMGDLQSYDPKSTIPTPNIKKLAEEGVLFTNVHAGAAVCTPSRYSLLTGEYPHRAKLTDTVLRSSYDEPLLDHKKKLLGHVFQAAGYKTAAFGKWHLGMNWASKNGNGYARGGVNSSGFSTKDINFTKPISDGPLQKGFDYFFGVGSSINHGPYTFIENDRVTELPKKFRKEIKLENRPFREGWVSESWKDDGQGETISNAAFKFIKGQAQNKEKPFFIYYASLAPHSPWVPPISINGQTIRGMGGNDDKNPARNDMIYQTDVILGNLINLLEDPNGDGDKTDSLRQDTLIILTSDNGANIGQFYKHRGGKGSIYEAGHRVPFIVSWPGKVKVGKSDNLLSQVDLYASFASFMEVNAKALDSIDCSKQFLWQSDSKRTNPVLVTDKGQLFAVIDQQWKLIISQGKPKELYNLEDDPREKRNVLKTYPEKTLQLINFYKDKFQK